MPHRRGAVLRSQPGAVVVVPVHSNSFYLCQTGVRPSPIVSSYVARKGSRCGVARDRTLSELLERAMAVQRSSGRVGRSETPYGTC